MDDGQTGTNNLVVTVQVPAGVPGSVQVKYVVKTLFLDRSGSIFFNFFFQNRYLSAASVSDRDNITWAGQVNLNIFLFFPSSKSIKFSLQTLGSQLTVDGRFRGNLNIISITCDTSSNTCSIPVPAPGFALVFLSPSSPDPDLNLGQATKTFSTTAYTKLRNTATIESSVLATSNGHSGAGRAVLGSTSRNGRDKSLLLSGSGGMRGRIPGLSANVNVSMVLAVIGWLVVVALF